MVARKIKFHSSILLFVEDFKLFLLVTCLKLFEPAGWTFLIIPSCSVFINLKMTIMLWFSRGQNTFLAVFLFYSGHLFALDRKFMQTSAIRTSYRLKKSPYNDTDEKKRIRLEIIIRQDYSNEYIVSKYMGWKLYFGQPKTKKSHYLIWQKVGGQKYRKFCRPKNFVHKNLCPLKILSAKVCCTHYLWFNLY